MKGYIITIVLFMTGTIAMAYNNLDYKGYERVQGCYGECYEEYVRVHGTVVEQLQFNKRQLLKTLFSSIRGLWDSFVQIVTVLKVKVWVHLALAGRDQEYIIDRLTTYKNRGPSRCNVFYNVGSGRHVVRCRNENDR